ncbi:hypothetical protein B0H12DRAFT_1049457 [Mycena haematopus]|nr:hypothetical protein B0H12DRAFT_1049457 [Mycena haematopus]
MSPEKPIRIEDLWFSDGTVVILVENKMFRVHRTILAARSSVFRDMFENSLSNLTDESDDEDVYGSPAVQLHDSDSATYLETFLGAIFGKSLSTMCSNVLRRDMVEIPQSTTDDDMDVVDGCLVVRLYESAADFEIFLRAIFDSSTFMPWPASADTAVIAGILRLSHKYNVGYLHHRALKHLTRYDLVSTYLWRRDLCSFPACNASTPRELLIIIKAITEVRAAWLLPAAYYDAFVAGAHLLPLTAIEGHESIVRTLVVGSHKIVSNTAQISAFTSVTAGALCTDARSCANVRGNYLANLLQALSNGVVSPIHYYSRSGYRANSALCDACFTASLPAYNAAMSTFWDELPAYFGLPSWAELNRMKQDALLNT